MAGQSDSDSVAAHAGFLTTHWSVVLQAGAENEPVAADALARLCQTYWYPLYAYIRRRGYEVHDAQDLTQEFFARFLEKNYLSAVRRERGKFRWFLMCALKRFLANEWNRECAQKRGGAAALIPLDEVTAEGRYRREAAHHESPEKLYDQAWALTLLEQARLTLEREYHDSGRSTTFDQLKIFLSGDKAPVTMAEAGASIGLSEGAVKVAVHRLRQRYRDCLRQAIAQTVLTPAEVDEEVRQLFAVFS